MEDLKFCRIDSYNVILNIGGCWDYIVDVDEKQFKNVIGEAESCARSNDMDLITDIVINEFLDGVVYKNYRINGHVFAYIQYRSLEDDEL